VDRERGMVRAPFLGHSTELELATN
jgi:hypothetical protein